MFEFTRIIPGTGCDIIMVAAQEGGKTALLDVGMAFCEETAIEMVKDRLKGRKLDYIIMSHTHYDHIGALSAFREAFPEVKVIGSEYAAYILERQSARELIKDMSENAALEYTGSADIGFNTEGFYADITVKTGDVIDFGKEKLTVYNTPGHTKCSISLFDEESRTLLSSETTGVYENKEWSHMPVLTGYKDTMDSINLCLSLKPERILTPHLGTRTMEISPEEFLRNNIGYAEKFRKRITECVNSGISHEETMEILKKEFHAKFAGTTQGQPEKAFVLNTEAFIRCLRKEFPEDFKI